MYPTALQKPDSFCFDPSVSIRISRQAALKATDEFFDLMGISNIEEADFNACVCRRGGLECADAQNAFEAGFSHVEAADVADTDFIGVAPKNAPKNFDAILGDKVVTAASRNHDGHESGQCK